ncbi:DNA repair protein [Allomyces macrogynus ATCC 38327]|uniref:DNA repair protein n=1 Tax=Allomyces macrogynus (strain ATCC 38327) TaxID=578462 RepID=A0A0L0SIP7_ALLM3|nr:DNA repair protein [Allomyces macrogynus ATCC 38327]|eukprot:KNE62347.1 DNA repair protein [Allomyces macrogynus ATCC 38327]
MSAPPPIAPRGPPARGGQRAPAVAPPATMRQAHRGTSRLAAAASASGSAGPPPASSSASLPAPASAAAGPAEPSAPSRAQGGNDANSKKRSWVSSYYDYNLAEMKDTRGGFLDEDHGGDDAADSVRPFKKQATASVPVLAVPAVAGGGPWNLPMRGDMDVAAHGCRDCSTVADLDPRYATHYDVIFPDKYALLTKTEVREDYLLTEEELRDNDRLPVWRKPNPKKNTYHDMWLYLREHVEAFAVAKWGSLEKIDAEIDRREEERRAKREVKQKKQVAKLRQATRTSLWRDKIAGEAAALSGPHVHEWVPAEDSDEGEGGENAQVCRGCGMRSEIEEI